MNLENHYLTGDIVTIQKSPNISGKFSNELPDTIIIHFTGGRSAKSSANWLCNDQAKASAHVVIGMEGEVYQLVSFDTIAWHAGKSSWEDRSGLNKYSIGIELDNPGRLEKRESGYFTWFGTKVPEENVVKAVHRNETEATYWHSFTEQQISACEDLCRLLIENYPVTTILGHEEISPGRKVDPGPAYPLDKLRDRLLFNNRSVDDGIEPVVETVKTTVEHTAYVTASLLNIRSAPNISGQKVSNPLKKGTVVKVVEEYAEWSRIKVETEGWVSSEWLKSTKG